MAALRDRIARLPAPVLAALVLGLTAVMLFGDLGGPGLWDPWEMNPAHLARAAASPPLVLVAADRNNAETEKLFGAGEGSEAVLQWLSKGSRRGARPSGLRSRLKQARAQISRRDYHAIVVPVAENERVGSAPAGAGIRSAWRELMQSIRRDLPGSRVLLVGPGARSFQKALRIEDPSIRALADTAALSKALRDLSGLPARLLRIRTSKQVFGAAPLRFWLTAFSYKVFGFTELATRLPSAVIGLLLIALVFLLGTWMEGAWVGTLASLILLSVPWFLVQSRSIAGEIGYATWLTLSVVGLAAMIYGRAVLGTILYALGFGLLFLEKGLFGPLTLVLVAFAFAVFEGRRRPMLWVMALLGGLVLAGLSALVLTGDGWSFWSHFRAMNHPFEGGPGTGDRTFDFLILQTGFGFIPWAVLLPFALAALAHRWWTEGDAGDANRGLILAWAAVPLALIVASLLNFAHCVYPAGPALALALALFAVRLGREPSPWPILALFVVLGLYLLMNELKLSPHPLVGTTTWDPPFVFAFREMHKGVLYPDVVRINSGYRPLGYLFILMVLYTSVRGSARIASLRRKMSSPRFYHGVLFGLMTFLVLDLVASVGLRVQTLVITDPRADRALLQQLNLVAWVRPEHWLLYFALLGYLASAILDLPSVAARCAGARGALGRGSTAALRAFGLLVPREPAGHPASRGLLRSEGVAAALACASGVALVGLSFGGSEASVLLGALLRDAFAIGGLAALILVFLAQRRRGSGPTGGLVLAASAWVFYVGIRAARAAGDPGAAGFLLVLVPGALLLSRVGPRLSRCSITRRLFFCGALLATAVALLAPMAIIHDTLAASSHLPGAQGYLARLTAAPHLLVLATLILLWSTAGFTRSLSDPGSWISRLVGSRAALLAIIGGTALVAGLMVLSPKLLGPGARGAGDLFRHAAWLTLLPLLALGLGWGLARWRGTATLLDRCFRLSRAVESTRFLVPALVVTSLLLGAMLTFRFIPELSLHVSQKHILDTYYRAEGRSDVGPNLFRHGRFSSASRHDRNFYIQSIPDVTSQATVLALLAASADVPVRVTESPFLRLPEHVVFRAFDPKNDPDGDGKRNWGAAAGVATRVRDQTLIDRDAHWEPGAWKGAILIDPAGRRHEVVANDATSLSFKGSFSTSPGRTERFYRIDHADAPDPLATAMERSRAFVVLPKTEFSALNFAYRRKHKGTPIPVIDDRSSRLVLLASWLKEGEQDRNWVARRVITPEAMRKLPGFRASRVTFDDKLVLEGWSIEDPMLGRGGRAKLTFYFRVKAMVARSYKVFVHIDRPGTANRIGTDHWVLNLPGNEGEKTCVGCFKTNQWLTGDVVVDSFDFEVPLGTPSGPQYIWMGLYEPNSGQRLRVSGWDKENVEHDGGNRVRIGILTVL